MHKHNRSGSFIKTAALRQLHRVRLGGLCAGIVLTLFSASIGAQNNITSKAQVPLPAALGEPGSINVSAAVGTVSDVIPIIVPRGRRGVQPRLSLSYNSMAGTGIVGLGWGIGTGSVERWRGDGTPTVGREDRYSYSLSGAGGELRDLDGDGMYRARIESVYRPFEKKGGAWGMYDGQGTHYRFGGTAGSRIDGELWLLDRVEDPHGNTITYHYASECELFSANTCADPDNRASYLSEIRYTGHVATNDPGAHRVVFEYEARPDTQVSYLRGVREAKNLRLRQISVFAQADLVRRYRLAYGRYADGPSLLESVVLVGADDASEITLRTASYGERPAAWATDVEVVFPLPLVDDDGVGTGARLADVNGDGFADALGNDGEVHLGDGAGGFTESTAWSGAFPDGVSFVDDEGTDLGVRLLDLNGDARPDLFIATQTLSKVLLNTGTGWQEDTDWTANLAGLSALEIAFSDENGAVEGCLAPHCADLDNPTAAGCTPAHCVPEIPEIPGTPEIPDDPKTEDINEFVAAVPPVPAVPANPADCTIPPSIPLHCSDDATALNCVPDHCLPPVFPADPNASEKFALVGDVGQSKGVELADVNGDGLVDIVWSLLYDGSQFLLEPRRFVRAVFLNGGDAQPGWHLHNGLAAALAVLPTAFVEENRYEGYSFQDVNGDGLSDIVRSIEGKQAIYLGNGGGWSFDPGYSASMIANGIFALDADLLGQGLVPTDFNDDGLLDYLRADGAEFAAFRNTGSGWTPSLDMQQVLTDLAVAFIDTEGGATDTTIADVNGDGISDLITVDAIQLSGALRSGAMVRATSALGEVTEIDWTSSTRFDNGIEGTDIQGLPFAMPVVDRLTRADGRGNTLSTEFDYAGGLFAERGFRGFRWAEEKPSVGLRSESIFYQDEARSSQPMVISAYDSENMLRARGTSVVETVAAGPYITQVRLVSTDSERFDPGGSSHSSQAKTYDDRLQVLTIENDADVGPTGDERTTTFSWVRNDAAGFWGSPSRSRELGPDDELLAETITLYDGMLEGQIAGGLPTQTKERVSGAPGDYVTRSLTYDSFGNPVTFTNGTGDLTTFSYDTATSTFRTGSVDALGRALSSDYDPRFGILVRDENASGNATVTELDAFGRISRVVASGDEGSFYGTKSYVYSALGDPGAQWIHLMATENAGTDEVFESSSFFDARGNIYESWHEGPNGQKVISQFEFDEAGQPLASTLPFFEGDEETWTITDRDELGRAVKVVDALGEEVTITYQGLRVDVLDARGFTTSWISNGDGDTTELTLTVDGVDQVTHYDYDVLGRRTRAVDALGNETLISYDLLGRRTRLDDPNAGVFEYFYDAEGRLVEQKGPDGNSLLLRYSATGELVEKELPDGTVHRFRYGGPDAPNAVGKLVEVEDAAGVLMLAYDARGQVVERRRSVNDRTYVTGLAFDSLDRVRRVTYPDGFIVEYEYDAGNNLAGVYDGDGRALADGFQYNASNRITEFTFGNGVISEYSYDELIRMVSARSTTDKGADIQDLAYAYDSANNVLALDDFASGLNQQFEYDEASRLIAASGPWGEERYEYDAIGNLLAKGDLYFAHDPLYPQRVTCGVEIQEAVSGKKSKPNSKTVDPCAAQLPAVDPNQMVRAFAISYDARGNVATKGDRSFEYDGENRLLGVRKSNGKLIEQNRYDASGELVVQQTSSETKVLIDGLYEEGVARVSRHVYAGPLLIATLVKDRADVVLIESTTPPQGPFFNTAGFSVAGLIVLLLIGLDRLFGWSVRRGLVGIGSACRAAPGRVLLISLLVLASWPTAVLAKAADDVPLDQRFYYHANHLGSVNVVTDDDGKVTARRDYRPYGEPENWSGANAGPRELLQSFQGQKYDDNTGLYNFKARYYDSELGRFLSADTVVADTDDPRTLHRYAFAGGNPVQFVDPTGRSFFSAIGDAFVSAGNWIADNAVAIITVIVIIVVVIALVALTVFTGGLATAALLGAAAGFATFGGIALSQGKDVASAEFWGAAATGAVLGALVFSAGFLIASGASGVLAGAIIGAATGGLEQAIACATGCGGVENLLLPIAQGVLIGGILGAIGGGVAGKFLPRGSGVGKQVLRFMIEPGKFGLVVKTAYAGSSQISGAAGVSQFGGRRTAVGDTLRLMNIGVSGGNAKTVGQADTTPAFFGLTGRPLGDAGLNTSPASP